MARSAQRPQSLTEAKCEFRAAADAMSLGASVRRHPVRYASFAFMAGLLVADHPKLAAALLRGAVKHYLCL